MDYYSPRRIHNAINGWSYTFGGLNVSQIKKYLHMLGLKDTTHMNRDMLQQQLKQFKRQRSQMPQRPQLSERSQRSQRPQLSQRSQRPQRPQRPEMQLKTKHKTRHPLQKSQTGEISSRSGSISTRTNTSTSTSTGTSTSMQPLKLHERIKYQGSLPISQLRSIITIAKGDDKMFKLLLKQFDIDPSINDNQILRESCCNGSTFIVKVLLKDKRVNPESQHNAPLKCACQSGSTEIVKMLLNAGVRPSTEALHLAHSNNHTDIVKMLRNYSNKLP